MTTEDDWDPLDALEHPTLREQVEPYLRYGSAELAIYLLHFEKSFGGPGLHAPANVGAEFHCPQCKENVRSIARPGGPFMACPLCGLEPGMLTLGRGPK